MFRKGFTLIELLIVVAIIAILAAIAVPNFLEAQVRAKVSRAKADMRSIATAVESYWVDNNVGPYNLWAFKDRHLMFLGGSGGTYKSSWFGGSLNTFAVLTTPIAYISTNKLEDPFSRKGLPYDKSSGLCWGPVASMGVQYSSYCFLNIDGAKKGWSDYTMDSSVVTHFANWCLVSIGPDQVHMMPDGTLESSELLSYYIPNRDIWNGQPGPTDLPPGCRFKTWEYDPTNGTKSKGDILRWSGGGTAN